MSSIWSVYAVYAMWSMYLFNVFEIKFRSFWKISDLIWFSFGSDHFCLFVPRSVPFVVAPPANQLRKCSRSALPVLEAFHEAWRVNIK